jgi:lysophospholipase L1-like esterase
MDASAGSIFLRCVTRTAAVALIAAALAAGVVQAQTVQSGQGAERGKGDLPAGWGGAFKGVPQSLPVPESVQPNETSIFNAGTTSLSSEDGTPAIPTIDDIPEVPANVALSQFYDALSKLEKAQKKTVTILHIGDSHIAADRFSSGLREQFQSRFGDAGRGMMTPGLYLAQGVKFDRGGKWRVSLSSGDATGPFGITGAKLTANKRDAWIRLTAKDQPFTWCEVTFDSGPENGTVLVSLDGQVKEVSTKGTDQSWRNLRLEQSARELMIRPVGDGQITVHSIAIGTSKPGVRYVNLGLPGASMLTPLTWDQAYLQSDLKRLAPDLIVLSYGTGESFNDNLDLRDYEARASVAIARLRKLVPTASLLVIGPPDVAQIPKFASSSVRVSDVCRALSPQERAEYSKRIEANDPRLARWHPPLNLGTVRSTLRRLAAAHNGLFWDWSKLMGGPCGIHAWVHSKPALAANDHIHLTEEGSKRSARLLFRDIMTDYDALNRAVATK